MPIERRALPAPPLAGLPAAVQALADRGDSRTYRKGVLLIQEGDHGDTLYIVLAGSVRAYSAGDNGREITYGVYGPGEYVGEMSLDGGPRSATVETIEPTKCAVITRETLTRYIAEHPDFAFELLSKIIRRARAATLSTKQLALNDVYGRLKVLLDSLAVPCADGTRVIHGRLTHQEIANRLGCSREMVSRVMKDLERGGYVRTEPGGVLRLCRELPHRW